MSEYRFHDDQWVPYLQCVCGSSPIGGERMTKSARLKSLISDSLCRIQKGTAWDVVEDLKRLKHCPTHQQVVNILAGMARAGDISIVSDRHRANKEGRIYAWLGGEE